MAKINDSHLPPHSPSPLKPSGPPAAHGDPTTIAHFCRLSPDAEDGATPLRCGGASGLCFHHGGGERNRYRVFGLFERSA
ncbi:unnamed protein product [Cuscuta campestris]|uniref:Uncharacterized protein n=1 Tax=Cuscuta campestris TaxID=132261 RepID=A0A484KQT9_9ASTE|nr:unnamed protein product [Cuscuta campestris]